MRGFNSWRLQEIECIEKDLVGLWKFFRAVVLLCIFLSYRRGVKKTALYSYGTDIHISNKPPHLVDQPFT